jgi:hypothetical protein
MQDLVLIRPLNAQNIIVSNAKMSHHVAFSMGGSGDHGCTVNVFIDIPHKIFDVDKSHRTMMSWKIYLGGVTWT